MKASAPAPAGAQGARPLAPLWARALLAAGAGTLPFTAGGADSAWVLAALVLLLTAGMGAIVALGEPRFRRRVAAAVAAALIVPAGCAVPVSLSEAPTTSAFRFIFVTAGLVGGPMLASGLVALFRRRRAGEAAPLHPRAEALLALLIGGAAGGIAIGLWLVLAIQLAENGSLNRVARGGIEFQAIGCALGLSLFAIVELAPSLARRWGFV
jgi:hypothetical protein